MFTQSYYLVSEKLHISYNAILKPEEGIIINCGYTPEILSPYEEVARPVLNEIKK